MTGERGVREILESARLMLEIAQQGAADFHDGGTRRRAGLHNAVTTGRSVTFTLQNLRGKAEGFDEWYADALARLLSSDVDKWFVKLRNRLEKEGHAGVSNGSIYIAHLDVGEMLKAAPPGVVGLFVGDELGRSGWEIEAADGQRHTVYFKVPSTTGRTWLNIADAPGGRPVDDLLDEWLSRLVAIVSEAEERFAL